MSKEYEVKFSEIFPVPHTQTDIDSDLDNVEMQKSDDAMDEDEHDTQNNDATENCQKPTSTRPPKRLAALQSRKRTKEIVSCLHVQDNLVTYEKLKHPTHGWNYEDWIREIDDDPYYETLDPILQFQSWCALQPSYQPQEVIFLHWFSEKYPNIDMDRLQSLAAGLAGQVIDTLSNSSDDDPTGTETEESYSSPVTTPFTQMLESLGNVLPQLPREQDRAQSSMGLLQFFPPVDEDDDMTWDDETTPPELVKITEDQIDDANHQLDEALKPRKLFVTDEDLDDLTSEDSIDDVFQDDSILEVSINGKRRFRRQTALRRRQQTHPIEIDDHTETEAEQTEDETDDQINENENDDHIHDEVVDESLALPADLEAEPNGIVDMEFQAKSRPKRRVQKVDYALYHSKGRKNN